MKLAIPSTTVSAGAVQWSFETCWWVPLLFGVAGLILGLGVPLLDELVTQKGSKQQQQRLLGELATQRGSKQQQQQQQQRLLGELRLLAQQQQQQQQPTCHTKSLTATFVHGFVETAQR
jgi:hypothetical protein